MNDFKVVYTLFIFLVIIKGLEKSHLIHNISLKLSQRKFLPQKLILFTAVLSMFVTNDVALFVMIPLTISLDIEGKTTLVILETLVANGVSSLMPFGNPQNIFIYYYYYYNVHPLEFIKTIAPFSFISLGLIMLASLKLRGNEVKDDIGVFIKHEKKAYVYIAFFLIFVLSVLKVLPLGLGVLPIIYAVLFDKRSLKIDYFLLATFFAFFGFTDNLMRILRFNLDTPMKVFLFSAFGSQAISNVPSALLFADFTLNWKSLLWGVSVGGYGNLIGSLANFITYRFYKAKYKDTKGFLLKFHLYGYLFFFIGIFIYSLVMC